MSTGREMSSFFLAWLKSRPGSLLHRTAFIVALLAIVSVPAFLKPPDRTLAARYRKAGFDALRKDDAETAAIYFKRMGRLDARDAEGRYGMALAAEKLGNLPLAHRLMVGLADEETPYPLAHSWLAEQILKAKSKKLSDDDYWQVRRHLEAATSDPASRTKSHAILGAMLLSRNEPHEAIPHLKQVVTSRPELRIPLAEALSAIGEHEHARAEVDRALTHFRAQSLASPDNADCVLIRVQCELMSGDKATAERVLKKALVRFPEDARFTKTLQEMHLTSCDNAINDRNFDLALRHLNEALNLRPESVGLLERFTILAGGSSPAADMALNALQDVVATGRAPAATHLAIGGAFVRRDQIQEAIPHFEAGLRHNPNSVALLNNLAWCLSKEDRGDNERALQLIDLALQKTELTPSMRAEAMETRGQILVRLQRYAEALVCLEQALPRLANKTPAHAALSVVYEELGEEALARTHRTKAQSTAKQPSNSRRIR